MDPDRDPKLAEAIKAAKQDPRQMTVDEVIEVASKGLDGKPPVSGGDGSFSSPPNRPGRPSTRSPANVGQEKDRAKQDRIKDAVRKQLRTKTFRGK